MVLGPPLFRRAIGCSAKVAWLMVAATPFACSEPITEVIQLDDGGSEAMDSGPRPDPVDPTGPMGPGTTGIPPATTGEVPVDTGNAADCSWNEANFEGEVEMADLIDDFEQAGRSWITYSDGTGNLTPPPDQMVAPQGVTGTASRAPGSVQALRVAGSGFSVWGGGVGTDFSNPGTAGPLDASAYEGIAFWAKGSGRVRLQVPIAAVQPPEAGGTCNAGDDCFNVHGVELDVGSDWTPYHVPFSALAQHEGWGLQASFDAGATMSLQFAVAAEQSLDLWIDDIGFYQAGAMPPAISGCRGVPGGEGGSSDGGGGSPSDRPTGAIPIPGPPGSCSTSTTRYWDCCKPHCGWSGNVGGSPVTTCSTDDVPTGADVASVCDGGSAMTCTSNAPWAVNDDIAFGFAVAPQSEGDACGRCYQLDFDGGLAGKVMFVQATNIGFDVVDHFDILIPGGGVGLMQDGCGDAFPLLVSESQGATYGGFATACGGDPTCIRGKCEAVFGDAPDALAGCLWYLDWFRGADNPIIRYKEVVCPPQLAEVSGIQGPGSVSSSCN